MAAIDIPAKFAALCFQCSIAVKDAKKDIERLQRKVAELKDVPEGRRGMSWAGQNTAFGLSQNSKLSFLRLKELYKKLHPGKTSKVMSRLRVRGLNRPFTSKGVQKIVVDLSFMYWSRYERLIFYCYRGLMLGRLTPDPNQEIDLAKYPLLKERRSTRTWRSIMQDILSTLGSSCNVKLWNGRRIEMTNLFSGYTAHESV